VVTTAASPPYKRPVAGAGTIRDVTVSKGWAYVAASRFATLNLADPAATFNFPVADPSGDESALEIVGGLAFTAEYQWFNDARIHIYDVSTPSAPRWIRSQGLIGGMSFTGLAALGSDYLIGISPDKPNGVGRDCVVIDRRDIYNLKVVASLDVANFDGFRGKVVGNTLYIAGAGGGMAVVDLTNPASPVLKGIVKTPGAQRG